MYRGKKYIKKSKYVFLDYLKGPIFAWIGNNDNYVKSAKLDPMLQEASPWRWKQYGLRLGRSEWKDLPTQMVDGLDAGKWVRKYYTLKYPNCKVYDFEGQWPNSSNVLAETKNLLLNENNWIAFESAIEFNDWAIRPDVIVKINNKVFFIEVKAVTQPLLYHGLDVMFQREIAKRNNFDVDNWKFILTIINNEYRIKDNFEQEIKYLFKEWDSIFETRQADINNAVANNKDIPLTEFFKNNQFLHWFEDFPKTLKQLEAVQELDEPPNDPITYSWNQFMDSDYLPWALKQRGITKRDSVFALAGDSGFDFNKKLDFFNEGKKTINELKTIDLLNKETQKKFKQVFGSLSIQSDLENIKTTKYQEWKENNYEKLKRIIQRDTMLTGEKFIDKQAIKNLLTSYQNGPIYMYDFETVSQALPRTRYIHPYEQAPYQFSLHIITDANDFDFETMNNIIHIEWLATEQNFYLEFWKEFSKAMSKYGPGVYVSYNKAFEQTIIKNFLKFCDENQAIKLQFKDELEILTKIHLETIDLMDFFKKFSYYVDEFNGSYSIKKTGKHFAKKLNYSDLDKAVQKGDQSAFQMKIWLIENNEQKWQEIRQAMLQYCEYDTLSMVAILQGLKQLNLN